MSVRKCTSSPGFGKCCAAAQQGLLGQPFRITVRGTQRCAQCDQIQKRNGSPGFKFRFHKSAQCGLGPSGCPALAGGGAANVAQIPVL